MRLALMAAAGAALFLAVTYVQVRNGFSHRPGRFPSQIYSAPLSLTPGLRLSPAELQAELTSRGYRPMEGEPTSPGLFRRRGSTVDVHLNSFRYPEGVVAGFPARVRFRNDRILRCELLPGGRDLDVLVLEPRLLGAFHGPLQQARTPVGLAELPRDLVQAVLVVEDRRFYDHGGFDPRGMLRALWRDVRARDVVQGGSTITQQLIKNVLLTHDRTLARKLRELVMAPMLESMLTKDEILELYLNEIYLGQKGPVSIIGVGEAARFYFGRDASDLDLAQSALLAGLIRSPGGYNPWVRPEVARKRRDEVLGRMAAAGAIAQEQAERARARSLALADATGSKPPEAGYFLAHVRGTLDRELGRGRLETDGLRLFTTLEPRLQAAAARALRDGLERLESDRRVSRRVGDTGLQGAVVVLNPRTGAVLAMVGGRDFGASMFNRAVDARRQVGSLFKPFVYLTALEAAAAGPRGGLTAASILDDAPLTLTAGGRAWSPGNNDGQFSGPVTVREALARSINVPAVRAAQEAGIDRVAETAVACGFSPDIPRVPALALGSAEASPLEVAVAFSTLAAGGRRPEPRWLRGAADGRGRPLEVPAPQAKEAVSPAAAYVAVDLMREVVATGTGRLVAAAGLWGEVAGKTGTTNERRDAWFVGFTPDFLAVVWVGVDDNRPMGLEGSQAALPIWLDLVRRVRPDSGLSFPLPDDVAFAWIDPESGGLAVAACPRAVEEVYIAGTEPRDECELHERRSFWRRLFGR